MWGPCACPRPGLIRLHHETKKNRTTRRTGTRPPPFPAPTPCPYRTGAHRYRLIHQNAERFHQDGAMLLLIFGCQESSIMEEMLVIMLGSRYHTLLLQF